MSLSFSLLADGTLLLRHGSLSLAMGPTGSDTAVWLDATGPFDAHSDSRITWPGEYELDGWQVKGAEHAGHRAFAVIREGVHVAYLSAGIPADSIAPLATALEEPDVVVYIPTADADIATAKKSLELHEPSIIVVGLVPGRGTVAGAAAAWPTAEQPGSLVLDASAVRNASGRVVLLQAE